MKRDMVGKITRPERSNKKKLETEGQLAYNAPMLKNLRLKLGITQEQLADEIGIGVRTVRRFESGQKTDTLASRAIKTWLKEVEWQDRVATKSL